MKQHTIVLFVHSCVASDTAYGLSTVQQGNMARWLGSLGSLASNVESLLDRVDQAASETFVKDVDALPTYFDDEGNVLPAESQLPKSFGAIAEISSYTPPPTAVGKTYTSVQMDYEPEKMWSTTRPSKLIAAVSIYIFIMLAFESYAIFCACPQFQLFFM